MLDARKHNSQTRKNKKAGKQAGWQAGRQAGWQAGRQAGWLAGKQAGKEVVLDQVLILYMDVGAGQVL